MKHNNYLDDLEAFVQEAAEGHRMYPNDRVWRNINQQLHGNTRWPALTFGAILTGAAILAGLIFIKPDKELFKIDPAVFRQAQVMPTDAAQPTDGAFADLALQPPKAGQHHMPPVASSASHYHFDDLSTNRLDAVTAVAGINPTSAEPRSPILAAPPTSMAISKEYLETLQSPISLQPPGQAGGLAMGLLPKANNASTANELEAEAIADVAMPEATTASMGAAVTALQSTPQVMPNLKPAKSRWQWQVYATPSISNRVLLEDKAVNVQLLQNGPSTPNISYGVNRFVRHAPKLGLEAGAALSYQVANNLRVKGGVQFNLRQYDVLGFRNNQAEIAEIRLINANGTGTLLQSYTNLSSILGTTAAQMSNRFVQVSVPIGFDLQVAQGPKLQLYLGSTLQPTLQIAQRSLLISADYKHFVNEPDLLRRFNINAGVEAFAAFKAAGLQWQVGPQLRYQMTPVAIKAYPIREHLIDYGLKIGVVKPLK